MTKQEIEKTLENGEDVWAIVKNHTTILPYKANLLIIEGVNDNGYIGNKAFYKTTDLFETKAKAEHYLHHANVTRTEQLPFLTWEEFKSGKNITFKAKNGDEFLLKAKQESIYLWWIDTNNIWKTWDLTEENFYRAYDECVRLFRGEK